MKPEELEAKMKEFSSQIDTMKKDFQVQLDVAKKGETEWKAVAQKKEEEAKKFQEEARKAEEDRKKAEAEGRKAEHKAFVEAKIREGKVVPAQQDAILRLMETLSPEGEAAKFTAKDGSSKSHSQLSLFKDIVENSPKRVSYDHLTVIGKNFSAPGPASGEGSEQTVEILHQGSRVRMPVSGVDMATKAYEYQAEVRKTQGRDIDYGEALIAVSKRDRQAA